MGGGKHMKQRDLHQRHIVGTQNLRSRANVVASTLASIHRLSRPVPSGRES